MIVIPSVATSKKLEEALEEELSHIIEQRIDHRIFVLAKNTMILGRSITNNARTKSLFQTFLSIFYLSKQAIRFIW